MGLKDIKQKIRTDKKDPKVEKKKMEREIEEYYESDAWQFSACND